MCALVGCGQEPVPAELAPVPVCEELRVTADAADVRGVIVLVNDTMRRDAPSLYGGTAETPVLDAFGAEHLVFENATSQAPWTKPSIATLFTSLHPSQHRVESHPRLAGRLAAEADAPVEADVLAGSLETLAEALHDAGYRTAAFVANPWLLGTFGFDQGFDRYDSSFAKWGARGDVVVDAGLAWLEALGPDDRFFLYLHAIDSHRPYGSIPSADLERTRTRLNSGRPLPTAEGRAYARRIRLDDGRFAHEAGFLLTDLLIREAYESGVERFDETLRRLLDGLRSEPGLWARTAIIVTSDHGEALYERGWGNHGGALFDEDVRVPFVARLPGVRPSAGRIDCLVGLIDLMPSLCDYLGVDCPSKLQGASFLGGAERSGRLVPRYLVTEGVMQHEDDRAIRNRRYKLVRRTEGDVIEWDLFDLEADPREQFDRLDPRIRSTESDRVMEWLRPALESAVDDLPAPVHGTAPLDRATLERLEALGYGEAPADR